MGRLNMADSLKQTMGRRGNESKGGAADRERRPRPKDRDNTAKMSELYRDRMGEGKPRPQGWSWGEGV